MSCHLKLAGVPCNNANTIGGIKGVLICRQFKHPSFYINPDSRQVDRIWTDPNELSEWDVWNKYDVRKGQSRFTQAYTVNENGSRVCQQTITLQMQNMDTEKRTEFEALMGQPVFVACKLKNGKWFVFGTDTPCECKNITGDSGQNSGDLSGFTATITCEADELAYEANWYFSRHLDTALEGRSIMGGGE